MYNFQGLNGGAFKKITLNSFFTSNHTTSHLNFQREDVLTTSENLNKHKYAVHELSPSAFASDILPEPEAKEMVLPRECLS